MFSIEETNDILDEIADSIPYELYRELNGGIVLLPEAKLHPKSVGNDLYIMGEYHSSLAMGRYIKIYYGSFCKVYGHMSKAQYTERLRKVLLHELRHHNESLAGYEDLILYDEQTIANYLERKAGQKQARLAREEPKKKKNT